MLVKLALTGTKSPVKTPKTRENTGHFVDSFGIPLGQFWDTLRCNFRVSPYMKNVNIQ